MAKSPIFPHVSWLNQVKKKPRSLPKSWYAGRGWSQLAGSGVPCRGGNPVTRAKSQRNGRTQKWMVYFRENPNLKGMMTGGTPMDWKPPCGKNTF